MKNLIMTVLSLSMFACTGASPALADEGLAEYKVSCIHPGIGRINFDFRMQDNGVLKEQPDLINTVILGEKEGWLFIPQEDSDPIRVPTDRCTIKQVK